MKKENIERAEILIKELRSIKKFRGNVLEQKNLSQLFINDEVFNSEFHYLYSKKFIEKFYEIFYLLCDEQIKEIEQDLESC